MAKEAAPKQSTKSRKKPARAMQVMELPKTEFATFEPSRPSRPSHEDIAKKAFELFASRGMTDGDDKHDWFVAEAQLRSA
jgi:hypothetical protein